ncbi:transposase family protein [Streptosporangium sp. NPDC020145]|uniref:transposase family protein n=1 Tax=Streptosporangium sp. NPDC020145 TaxID=3154694 RepID=UPI0034477A80
MKASTTGGFCTQPSATGLRRRCSPSTTHPKPPRRLNPQADCPENPRRPSRAERVTLRINGTETQVRRPKAHRPGRCAFVSGKKKQNTAKTTTISDGQDRTLWSGADRPGRIHGQTCLRTEGIAELFRRHPTVKAEVDEGYEVLANEFPDQISAPPKKPKGLDEDDAPLGEQYAWREQIRRQSSRRICVEHANAEHKQWRPLQRFLRRREQLPGDPPGRRRSGPTGPPSGLLAASRAPSSCSSARRPAESPTSRSPRPGRPSINSRQRRKD